MSSRFLSYLTGDGILEISKNYSIKQKELENLKNQLTIASLSNHELFTAIDNVLNLKDDFSDDTIIKFMIKYALSSALKKKVADELKKILDSKRDKEFLDKVRIKREFTIKMSLLASKMSEESNLVTKKENELENQIKELKIKKNLVREKFNDKWNIVREFVKCSSIIKSKNYDTLVDQWLSSSRQFKDNFSFDMNLFIEKRVKEMTDEYQINLSTTREYTDLVNSLNLTDEDKLNDMKDKSLSELLSAGDLAFLTSQII